MDLIFRRGMWTKRNNTEQNFGNSYISTGYLEKTCYTA